MPTMIGELTPVTEPGRRFVALAEHHATAFAESADANDRAGAFPFEHFDAMKKSGFAWAPLPADLGGLGVESLNDIMVAMSRLGRGDASTAIAANMHISGLALLVRLLRNARRAGDGARAYVLEHLVRHIATSQALLCLPISEAGTDLTAPLTEATPTRGGHVINGRKLFGTTSPVADLFFPTVRVPDGSGGYRIATAVVARDTPGLEVANDWDALGMRASGSHSVRFSDCFVPDERLVGLRDGYGVLGPNAPGASPDVNLPLIAVFLGVAEAARDHAVSTAIAQRKGANGRLLADRIPIQELVAHIEIDLAVARALAERLGRIADAFLDAHAGTEPSPGETNALMKEIQSLKYVVNRRAIAIVDRAMTVCGGAAYMSRHPLARLYRDVRAGPFMQPFAPYEALEYIGRVALGRDLLIDR